MMLWCASPRRRRRLLRPLLLSLLGLPAACLVVEVAMKLTVVKSMWLGTVAGKRRRR